MFSHPTLIVVFLAFGLREPIAIANPLRLRKVCNKSSKKCKKQNRRARLPEETKTLTYVASRPFEKKKRDAIVNIFDGEDFSMASAAPSARPTRFPSFFPSAEPSSEPSFGPSTEPSFEPSVDPSLGTGFEPSNWPSDVPSALKSIEPTQEQSAFPSASLVPSAPESNKPTSSSYPSIEPTDSDNVSMEPSVGPSNARTTMTPSTDPSKFPSEIPTSSFFPTSSNFTDDLVEDFPTFPSNFTDDDFVEVSSMPSLIPSTTPSLGPSVSTQPSPYPTLEDCLISKEERAARIFALLDAAGDATKIRDQRTPQGLAADWLINQDFRKECPDEKIVQRWVVAVFYFSTDGESWSRCSAAGSDPCGSLFPFVGERRFLSDFSECEWAGITCNDDDCVTEIEFESNGLIGTIPTELGLLKELAVLGMERGGLSLTIPTEIGKLTNLVFLDLDYNELTGTIPSTLYLLTNLETLDLNDNFLEGDIDSIGVLNKLEFLQLQSNQFTGTVPEEMGNLALMTTLNLHENSFTGTMPESVCEMRETNGGLLKSLIADCKNSTSFGPDIECDCCSSCRG